MPTMTDPKLIEFTMEFRKGIMGRRKSSRAMCFMIAAPLQGYLSFLGIETELVEGEVNQTNHYWLELPDGRVLDPTADQFDLGLPPVYLGKPNPEIHRRVDDKSGT
jgi:hypothetical protein